MSFTSGTRVSVGNPCKANAEMDVLIANAEHLITNYQDFSGAMRAGSTSCPDASETSISLSTTGYYDTDSYYSGGTPTRLTVPSGIVYVQLRCEWNWAGIPIINGRVRIYKNGSVGYGLPSCYWDKPDAGTMISSWVAVSAGDYFEVKGLQGTGSAKTLAVKLSIRGSA